MLFEQRYNENHDPSNGQFSDGSGSSGGGSTSPSHAAASANNAAKPKPEAAHAPTSSYEFVSPSVASHLDFGQAVDAVSGAQQKTLHEASVYINSALNIDAHEYDIVGAWADGAENSVLDVVDKSDWDTLKVSAAMKGYIADQKQVLIFQEAKGGKAAMAHFEATGDLANIHRDLLQDGVAFHTLVPHDGGATVYVADLDGSAADAVEKAASRYDAEVGIKWGRAEFLGTQKQDGSDREQRDDARNIYAQIIDQSKVEGHHEVWSRVGDRWGKGLEQRKVNNSASALFDSHHDTSATADSIINSVPGAAAAVAAVEGKLKGGVETNAPVSKGGFIGEDGKYTAEREALHAAILGELFNAGAVKAATPAAGEKPVMTILGGRGGSGKSWFTKQGIADASRAVYINADDLQAKLPGYEGWNAALYHEEASDIVKHADDIARELHLSVIHDATMRTPGSSAKRVEEYKKAGYAVNGHYMFLPPQTSTERALKRFIRGGTEGRYVPPSYLLNSTTNERTFDGLKGQFDKWTIYENTGASPKLVASSDQENRDANRDTDAAAGKVRARFELTRRRGQALFGRLQEKDHRSGEAGSENGLGAARGVFFGQRYNENHDPSNGQFAESGGSGGGGSSSGGGSTKSSASKSAKPAKSAPATATAKPAGDSTPAPGGDKKKPKLDDFEKAGVRLSAANMTKEHVDRFIDQWESRVGVPPDEFKKQFLGGLDASMAVSTSGSKWKVSGDIKRDGAVIGNYTRSIDWTTKKAESEYFVLNRDVRDAGIGKKLLAGNVEMYQRLGVEAVKVHANIDVGGYAWAKYGYVPTRDQWRALSADIRSKLGARDGRSGGGGDTYTPDSWDELYGSEQESIHDEWKRSTRDEFLESEISNWRDSGGALEEAKGKLARDFSNASNDEWANDIVNDFLDEREANGKAVPYTKNQIMLALSVEYEGGNGDGRDDPEFSFDDDRLKDPSNHDPDQGVLPGLEKGDLSENLTQDMRDELTERLTKAFNDKAENDASDVDPPDYLGDSVSEYQDEYWEQMDERDRYKWARDNGALPEREHEPDEDQGDPDDVEKDEGSGDTLMKLASSNNPKAIWAIADSPRGKQLLLGSDWYGELNLRDPETMERFNAYVGKKK